MAKVTVGTLNTFNHQVQDWCIYKDRLEQWFLANDIVEDSDKAGCKRRAILLSNLAESSYKLVRDLALPRQVTSLSYKEVVELFDGHFKAKKCTFAERSKFYNCAQYTGESLAEWAARVRGLATHCGFVAAHLDEQLRDRFVIGMNPGPERDTLFTKELSELTLNIALELAEGVQSARLGARESLQHNESGPLQVMRMDIPRESTSTSARSSRVQQRRPQAASALARAGRPQCRGPVASEVTPQHHQENGSCVACGYIGHNVSQCRFSQYKCKKCGIKGHLKRMCPKTVGSHNFVECSVDSEDDGKRFCFNIRTYRGEPMRQSVLVNNFNLIFELDTGSPVTVISEQLYKKYFSNLHLEPSDIILHSYNGNKLVILGSLSLLFTYNKKSININVYVVRDGGPPLLGRDFISEFNLRLCSMYSSNNFVDNFVKKYPNLFSDSLGCLKNVEIDLNLKPGSKPIFCKARPLPFALRDSVEKEINRLVDLGILVPVKYSEYASPIVPVLKRDGSMRLCADFSVTINKQLLVEKFPLPRQEDLFSKLYGGRYYSKLDLSQAYNQLKLKKECQTLTCINTHKGLFKFTRLVFGLASAPAIFQRTMECILGGLEGTLLFLDDILISAVDKKQMLSRLQEVFSRLEDAGLTLRKDKCSFFQRSVSYLGFVIDENGIHKCPDKVKAILECRPPTNISELKSFLGLVNYYHNFIFNASSILNPLHRLLQKNVPWCWTREHDKAINMIKNQLASDNTLAHFNPKSDLILTVDASPHGLGAILSQTENGIEKPVCYASRSLSAAEKRYSQIQKEATAIIFGVRKFHQYLYGREKPFILKTDHKPLISIFNPNKGIPEVTANRLQRYAIFLSAYNYKIEYVTSSRNCADYLSRAVSAEPPAMRAAHATYNESSLIDVDRSTYINFIYEGQQFLSLSDVEQASLSDNVLATVRNYILNGWPNQIKNNLIKKFYHNRFELAIENNCIMRGYRLIIPERLKLNILAELHKGHFGITKIKAEARLRFWWPGMSADIEQYVGACAICNRLRSSPPRAPLTPWPYPAYAWHRVHLDFLGPLNGKTYLIIVDAYSKWVECFDVSNGYSSRVVIEKLCEVMARFGLFHTICSDNGTSFVSNEFKQFCVRNGIIHLTTPAYNPSSNGQAESYVKIIKKAIKSILSAGSSLRDLNIKLQEFLLQYRNSKHSTTNRSPAEVLFGHNLRCRLDLLKPNVVKPSDMQLDKIVKAKQSLQTDQHGGKRKLKFNVGDNVLVKVYSQNKHFWTRGEVIKKIGRSIFIVRLLNSNQSIKRHSNQLLKYTGGDDDASCNDSLTNSQACETVVPAFTLPSANSTSTIMPTDCLQARSPVCKELSPDKATVHDISQQQCGEQKLHDGSDQTCSNLPSSVDDALPAALAEKSTPQKQDTPLLKRQRKKIDYRRYL